ncbi:MAG: hypothetical protein AB2598_01655 [Candidatus Thiodiazotropha sp.]
MARFTPCQGKSACRENGEICLTCGRTLDEIAKLRDLIQGLTSLAITNDYENVDEFTSYVALKVTKMIDYQRQEQPG